MSVGCLQWYGLIQASVSVLSKNPHGSLLTKFLSELNSPLPIKRADNRV